MELKEKNFEEMSLKEFQKAVVLATKPWSAADGPTVNVTLEVDDQAPTILGVDANAVSPMWLSKSPDNSGDRLNREREQVIKWWIIASGASVLNTASRCSRSILTGP